MAKLKITGETPFSVLSHSFGVSQSNEGYTLNYSANGIDWTAWSANTPAHEDLFVSGIPFGGFFRLVGNQSEVEIIY